MTQIAMKFVQWDVPELENWKIARFTNYGNVLIMATSWVGKKKLAHPQCERVLPFQRGIALMGYRFDFSDVLKRYFVKQHGHIAEYYAIDKTALRSVLYGRIEDIIEIQ